MISKISPEIICLNETWLKDDSCLNLPGYNVVTRNRHGVSGGVAILINKNLEFISIDYPNFNHLNANYNINICTIKLRLRDNNIPIYITSVYSPPYALTNRDVPVDTIWKK